MESVYPRKIIVITYNASTYLMSKPENSTTDLLYEKLKEEIKEYGYAWLPWKNRAEIFPQSEVNGVREGMYEFYLLNKGENKQLYHIKADEYIFAEDDCDVKFRRDCGERLISDFTNTKSQMWMRVVSIDEVKDGSNFLKEYSFCNDINPGDSKSFETLFNKRVFGRSFLINSEYCIFFLRQDEDAKKPDVPLKPRQSKYAKSFSTVEGNRILLLSDLHCPFPESNDKMSSSYMQKLLQCAKKKSPVALVVAGDFSDRNKYEGYDDATKFISKLCVQNNIKKEAVVFAPGNHDIGYSNLDGKELNYSKDETKIQYAIFYKEMLSCSAKQSLCRGVKFIMKNGLPVEILALNSMPYKQDSDQRGFGLLTDTHLTNAAQKMGWTENSPTYSYRILVCHHPLFPVGDRSDCKSEERKQEVIINAKVVQNFIQKYGINLIITGHAHTDGYLRFIREGYAEGVCVWIGLNSCGSQESSLNSVYCLDFSEHGKVKLLRADADSSKNFEWDDDKSITFNVGLATD